LSPQVGPLRGVLDPKICGSTFVARLLVINALQKGIMCVDEIGLCAQNMLTILGSIVDTTIGKAY
jgi:hypothetical protein